MTDAIILSDIHLGSHNSQATRLIEFLNSIRHGEVKTNKLIFNGDVLDSFDFGRMKKSHWKVLSLIRKLSDDMEVVWVHGNHDDSPEILSHLLGVSACDEYIFESGEEKILVMHGHVFDEFLDDHPILTWIGDQIYYFLQWIDESHNFAKMAKKGSKTFLRCAQKIEGGAVKQASKNGCSIVCCGHTHFAVEKGNYFNSGCWTELPCTYLGVDNGKVQLCSYRSEDERRQGNSQGTI